MWRWHWRKQVAAPLLVLGLGVCTGTLRRHASSDHASLWCHSYAMSHRLFTKWEKAHIPTEPESASSSLPVACLSLFSPIPTRRRENRESPCSWQSPIAEKKEKQNKTGSKRGQALAASHPETQTGFLISAQEIFKALKPPHPPTDGMAD